MTACASGGSVGLICLPRPLGRPRFWGADFTQLFNCEKSLQGESVRGTHDVVPESYQPLWTAGISGLPPKFGGQRGKARAMVRLVVPPTRLERATSGLEGECSIQLSYGGTTNLPVAMKLRNNWRYALTRGLLYIRLDPLR
jgi:hypothetical protein